MSHAPGIALAAIGTLSFGAVLGPEAPLIALGSVVGMVVALSGAFGQREQTVLATAGSFSAISALFGGPIVGGMMMVESGVAMGSALLPVLIPGFVAAAIGYVIFVGFGTWGGLHAKSLAVPDLPPYNGTHVYDLGIALAELIHVWFDVSPTLAVAVGAAAGMAAGTRLLITSTLFASLLVGTAGLDAVPAAVLAACAAWMTAQALDRRMAARQAPEAGLPVAEPG